MTGRVAQASSAVAVAPRPRAPRRPRPRAARLLVALMLLALAAPLAAQTESRARLEHGDPDYEPWLLPFDSTPADADALKARWQALAKEIETTPNASAGTYRRYGAMRTGILRWAPGGGFVYLYVYENYSVIDFSYGRVEATPSEVVFHVERGLPKTDEYDRRPLPRRWAVSGWKGAKYLIPVEEMREFGQYVAGLGAFNDFNGPCCEFAPFFISGMGDSGGGGAPPVVPRKYARLMLKPIEAAITSVGRKRTAKEYRLGGTHYNSLLGDVTLTPVRIDAGRRRGVRPNLLFRVEGAPYGQHLKITRAGRRHSEGVVIHSLDDAGKETCYDWDAVPSQSVACPPIAVGARVTTGLR